MKDTFKNIVLCILVFSIGCGGGVGRGGTARVGSGIKLRHQIMFRQGDDIQVFEGYMIDAGSKLMVRAFAGPGVDLFTVIRGENGLNHDELHLSALEDRVDMKAVGDDIARVYLGGCEQGPPEGGGSVDCLFADEKMTEAFDEKGRLVRREFVEAHGIGLIVTYSEHVSDPNGGWIGGRIELSWVGSNNSMIIKTVEVESVDRIDPRWFSPSLR